LNDKLKKEWESLQSWLKIVNNTSINGKTRDNALGFAQFHAYQVESLCEEAMKQSLINQARAINRAKTKLAMMQKDLAANYFTPNSEALFNYKDKAAQETIINALRD